MNKPEEERKVIFKIAILAGASILLAVILWSVVTETLFPLYNNKDYEELIYNSIGIPIILLGTGIFVYGGWVFVRDTNKLFNNNFQLAENLDIIKDKTQTKEKIKFARSQNTKLIFSTWKKGALWLLIGVILIIAGGVVINLKK